MSERPVLIAGASGFVGRSLRGRMGAGKRPLILGGRKPQEMADATGQARYLDVQEPRSIVDAMAGCEAAVYLVHGMAQGGDYEAREARAAENFLRAAEQAGLSRIVYLGGPRPPGEPSRHLRSRLRTGEILRSGRITTIELQASMIVGDGSESFHIVRDLAARLPVMVLPRWLESRSEPIAIDDVTFALERSLELAVAGSCVLPLPGPEVLSGRQILEQTAQLLGMHPIMVSVPFVSPTLSSYWIRWVTSTRPIIAEELVQGLRDDLVAPDPGFWKLAPGHERKPYSEAARLALVEAGFLSPGAPARYHPLRRLLAAPLYALRRTPQGSTHDD